MSDHVKRRVGSHAVHLPTVSCGSTDGRPVERDGVDPHPAVDDVRCTGDGQSRGGDGAG
ncbi:hypothetical protein AB0M61_20055 [Streptomyces sp. NPDC051642]|uniref:hypothetical protein n=1 Tax=Streptomyces sp. NPDC051642 TaxID=3154646 RepID=UPI0034296633